MYKIVYCFFNNHLKVTEYGLFGYILKRHITLSKEEAIDSIEVFPLTKCWDTFVKCLRKTCVIS